MNNIRYINDALRGLTVFRNLLDDPIVRCYMDHLAALTAPPGTVHPAHTYGMLYNLLANTENPMAGADPWQNHLLDLILDDENPFSRAAFTPGRRFTNFLDGVKKDLAILRLAFDTGAAAILEATAHRLPGRPLSLLPEALPLWAASTPASDKPLGITARRLEFKEQLAAAGNWEEFALPLAGHYSKYGCGILARYEAYKWQDETLTGIHRPDPVTLSDLVGYGKVREEIISNTEQFLHGHPANNILLYGDRGTGKSSTVKALLHEYGARGLRLVELSKHALAGFPRLMSRLWDRNHRYIIFIDDLSFEENETQYKDFKALLEGGLEARPQNVLVYATSNRRHLVRETFADRSRDVSGDEVRAMDSVQEKLSLADRFGITVIFPTPDQALFIEIVSGLARQRGLTVSPEELRRRALHWSSWHNGRSPRAARQFIDQLQGELAMENG